MNASSSPPPPQPPSQSRPQAPGPRRASPAYAPWLVGCGAAAGVGVVILVLLVILGVWGVRRRMALAKQAEARFVLGTLAKSAGAAFERDSYDDGAATPVHRLCASASASVPATLASVRAMKYWSAPTEWSVDAPRGAGFACLRFEMTEPQYYMYSYRRGGDGEHVGSSFAATANGDLDGDGAPSTFEITGTLTADGTIAVVPAIREVNPDE